MLQQSPKIPSEKYLYLPPIENVTYSPVVEKLARTHRENLVGAFALLTTFTVLLPYSYDVQLNRMNDTNVAPRITTIVEAPEGTPGTRSNTYNINGFDTNNSYAMTSRLAKAFQEVSADPMKSVDFEKATLNVALLADEIVIDTKADGNESINLAGNSTGGIIALLVAKKIIETTDIRVNNIYLYETPDGTDGLKAGSKKDLAMLMDWVALLPGAEDSNYVRDFMTMIMESSRYTNSDNPFENIGNFVDTFWESVENTRNDSRPRMSTLFEQGWIISNADLQATISAIGKMKHEKQMPTVVNIMSDPARATVVDTLKSTKNTKEYLYKADIDTFSIIIDSPTQRHTSYNFDEKANQEALALRADEIKKSNTENALKMALNSQAIFQQDTISNNQ